MNSFSALLRTGRDSNDLVVGNVLDLESLESEGFGTRSDGW